MAGRAPCRYDVLRSTDAWLMVYDVHLGSGVRPARVEHGAADHPHGVAVPRLLGCTKKADRSRSLPTVRPGIRAASATRRSRAPGIGYG
ncbi:MAG: hypothetical protein OXK79_10310 [Chloroflexota bacterium]|nr:hypothetical protein [Chloroflexota bacterium]